MNVPRAAATAILPATLAAGWCIARFVTSEAVLGLLAQALVYALFATGVGILLRQNGAVSFGHAVFFGAAGYSIAAFIRLRWMPAEWAIVLTPFAVAGAAFLAGLAIVRVSGVAFSMVTLAMGQVAFIFASRARGWTGGTDGLPIEWPARLFGLPQAQLLAPGMLFLAGWVSLTLMLALLVLLLRGRFGAITSAIRDNEERARFIGLETTIPRAAVYALSAFVTALAGVLAALNTGFVSPDSLHWSLSGVALMMAIIGGFHAIGGPALGAIVYFMLKDAIGDHTTHWMSLLGATLVAVIVLAPGGLAGLSGRAVRLLLPRALSPSPRTAGPGFVARAG